MSEEVSFFGRVWKIGPRFVIGIPKDEHDKVGARLEEWKGEYLYVVVRKAKNVFKREEEGEPK